MRVEGGKRAVLHRLRRVEGQMRGIHRMVEADAACAEVLTQVSSVVSALRVVAVSLLDEHIEKCVAEAVSSSSDAVDVRVREMSDAVARLVRS